MPRRADLTVAQTSGLLQFTGGGTSYLVEANNGDLYVIYVDTANDLAFRKSNDGGMNWSNPTVIFAGTIVSFAVWFDRWSNISAGLIHLAYTESGGSDTLYRTINTESSDALSTQTTIHAGTSTAAGGHLSIARARGGNVYCKTMIDAGAEGGFYRLPNANVPNGAWDAARTVNEALATQDQIFLFPGFASDNQDMIAVFVDASANGLSRQLYDDSANTWSESAIIADASFVDLVAATAFPHVAGAVDLTNSRIIIVAWSAIDAANADLRCFTITESAITETSANVVLNSTDDQGLAAFSLNTDTGEWIVAYAGASGGAETWLTSVNLYCKGSRDSGATWGPETKLTLTARDITWLTSVPRTRKPLLLAYHNDISLDEIMLNCDMVEPRATYILGVP